MLASALSCKLTSALSRLRSTPAPAPAIQPDARSLENGREQRPGRRAGAHKLGVAAAARVMQGGPVRVLGVDLRALIEEELSHRRMPPERRCVQRHDPHVVARHELRAALNAAPPVMARSVWSVGHVSRARGLQLPQAPAAVTRGRLGAPTFTRASPAPAWPKIAARCRGVFCTKRSSGHSRGLQQGTVRSARHGVCAATEFLQGPSAREPARWSWR